jgi:galactose mutarotase-like enzyme
MCREVTLRTKTSGRFIRVVYPQMPYLGIWHWPKTDAPYVCIEPWSSLPARDGVEEEFSCKSDLVQLLPGKTYENTWTITIGEE